VAPTIAGFSPSAPLASAARAYHQARSRPARPGTPPHVPGGQALAQDDPANRRSSTPWRTGELAQGTRPGDELAGWVANGGWGILRVLALVPILGGLVWFAAVVVGLGALLVAIWRARSTSRPAPTAA